MKTFQASKAIQRLPDQYFAKLEKSILALKDKGHDVINLAQGSPDQPTPKHIIESLQEAAEEPRYHKYSPFQGFRFLKEAAAEYYKQHYDVDLDPDEEVCVLFGGKGGLVEVSECLLDEGDVALVPDPGYPDYWSGVALANAKMEMMPLRAENDFLPRYNEISEEAKEKAKLLFLNYPNNPTGAVADQSFFEETVDFAHANDICAVHDFAYGAISFEGKQHDSFLQVPGAKETGIEIYTLSKTYNMAGWRVGFAAGNRSVIRMLNTIQDHMYVSLFGAVQKAAADALTGSQANVDHLIDMYEGRRNVLMEKAREIGWNGEAPKGSFFAWFPCPEGMTSDTFANKLLEEAHVAVAPGRGFGEYGEGYVRLGLVNDEATIAKALDRIAKLNLFR
ncbi:pyridoxal phosphate-dependent aminotransferase [Salicibibacter halophilus]|uniref:Pyridoxal phosphate-dependent aminotransferase n=1 Tax=Salicibibacter halophilus TaxID=2502791 RepID=A0A514LE15_9BACI|nr:pyridoxal phosphate-dependent aminotransferase [Salicibibacter halophilus]QDI90087.1 pyridoxal phosphate-dependent aminotransferase [Salicibibacter halophilus]